MDVRLRSGVGGPLAATLAAGGAADPHGAPGRCPALGSRHAGRHLHRPSLRQAGAPAGPAPRGPQLPR